MFENLNDFLRSVFIDAEHYCQLMKDSCDPDSDSDRYRGKIINSENQKNFHDATDCYLCNKCFLTEGEFLKNPYLVEKYKTYLCQNKKYGKVWDHDHLTGEYRGAAHSKCNLKCRNDRYNIDFFFHNGKGYDFHFIMNAVSELSKEMWMDVTCIPNNTERYMSLTIKGNGFQITFKDSLQFMPLSLEKLVNTQKDSKFNFPYMQSVFGDKAELLTRKGVYPYDWDNSSNKDQMVSLPPKEAFTSKLTGDKITDADYLFAKLVWKKMECKIFKDCRKVYLETDVVLLADIFESFRDMCLHPDTGYGLDPCHYFTAPGMAWDGALKMYGGKLDLLTDEDMVLFFEKGIRGGMSMISHRHAKANNPYLKDYVKIMEKSYIMYMDMNNLYGGAMREHLPVGNFKWDANVDTWTEEHLLNMKDDAPRGATLCVDLEYPKNLHDEHNDCPLCPERMSVTEDMFSPHNLHLTELAKDKPKASVKLVPNLQNKTNYVIHYRALKQCVQLGMKITKVHKVIFHYL